MNSDDWTPPEVAGPSFGPPDLIDYMKRRGTPVCDAMRFWLAGDASVPSLAEFRSRFGWAQRDWQAGLPAIGETTALMAERARFTEEFGFAVPTREALDRIAALSPLVEIGAGSGAWARLLAMRGADIIATDPAVESFVHHHLDHVSRGRWETLYCPVLPLAGKTAVRRWPERNVFCCWPSLNETWLRQAARAMRPGRALIVVREDATADERTWDYLEAAFRQAGDALGLPNWHFLHDYLECWIKRGRA